MSSTLTRFQPPVHTVAYMYRHTELDLQLSHSNDGFGSYSMDSRFPLDSDANSYAPLTENPYDEARYNRPPHGLGSCEFDDAQEGFLYGRMQDRHMNHASPQLLCPKPTLPPSQVSPQFSWSDWPSDAPINVCQVYSKPGNTAFDLYSSQDHETQYSFENQQSMVNCYPAVQEFVDVAANLDLTSQHHEDTPPPFFEPVPSFERGSSHSTSMNSRYYAAHQPILPEQRSSYSELTANLSFMSSQARPPATSRESTRIDNQDHHMPKGTRDSLTARTMTPSLDAKKNPYALGLNGPPLTSIGRKIPAPVPSDHAPPLVAPTTTLPSTTTKTKSSRSVNEPRRPSLACTFCRERKIACGRPPDGSEDLTCNQCARRSFRCRYLDLKSSPLVLSRASSKDSLSRKRK